MPVNEKQSSGIVLYQRTQYQISGVSRWYWDYKDNFVIRALDGSGQNILDIGCGEGILLEKLSAQFPDRKIIGIDFMQENVDICKSFGLCAVRMDVYHLDLPDNSIDGVAFMEVIEHLADPELAIRELNRVLCAGGKLALVFPNDIVFKLARLMMLRFREMTNDYGHVKQWTHREVNFLLNNCGFDVISHKSIPFGFWPLSLHGVIVARKTSK